MVATEPAAGKAKILLIREAVWNNFGIKADKKGKP